jgi:hypothetical protein
MNIRIILESIGILICAGLTWALLHKPVPDQPNNTKEAQTSPELAGVDKTEIAPPKVIVYAQEAKKKLKLPSDIQNDNNTSVLDSSKIPESDHSITVTTVIDKTTGESKTIYSENPLPWLSATKYKEVKFSYGMKNAGTLAGRVEFTDDLFQVKAIHFGINASLDTDSDYFIGAGISFKF